MSDITHRVYRTATGCLVSRHRSLEDAEAAAAGQPGLVVRAVVDGPLPAVPPLTASQIDAFARQKGVSRERAIQLLSDDNNIILSPWAWGAAMNRDD